MPKQKNHSGTKDRVKITKNDKVLVKRSGNNHFLEKKSESRKRTYAGYQELSGKIKRNVKRKLGV